jgi:hypothetical protein
MESNLQEVLKVHPEGAWPDVVRAWKFARNENWQQAKMILTRINAADDSSGFVSKLKKAVEEQADVPGVLEFPIDRFN